MCKEKEWSGVIWQVESWHSEEALGELVKRIGQQGGTKEGLISDNENGTWTWVGPSGPAMSLRENMCWVHDCVGKRGGMGQGDSGRWGSRVEGESGKVLGSVGELDEREGEGWWCGG